MSKIEDPKELQFRQVHPNWIDSGSPTRQAFTPTSKDQGCLSLDRSQDLSAKQSFENYTSLGLKSSGVYGIEVGEFSSEPHSIDCHASPIDDKEHKNPHHSHADFNDLTKSQRKTKSSELRRIAVHRGKLHP